MLANYNDEELLNEYIEYLSDKGKIIEIKDINKEVHIKFSSGVVFYFLLIVSIIFGILTIGLVCYIFKNGISNVNDLILICGFAVFTVIVARIAYSEKKLIKLNISYPNRSQIKINNEIFDIEKENCSIEIFKKYEYVTKIRINLFVHQTNYVLTIKKNNSSKSFQITKGHEEAISKFIYNFEYDILDKKE